MTETFGAGRGAIDLSSLAKPAPPADGGAYVVDVDESNFDATISGSMQHPIVVEFHSPRAQGSQLSVDLAALAAEAAGRWLLARVDVDAAPSVAAAMGVQAVPTVMGVVSGQLVPLWQGTLAKQEAGAYITELLRVAAANGVLGRAAPVAGAVPESDEEPAVDPRYSAAYDAMEVEDWAKALEEFDKLLAATPGDPEAVAGRAQASLLSRVTAAGHGVESRVATDPDDLDAILAAADLDFASGAAEQAFSRLIAVVRDSSGADRDTARTRLLELFEALGTVDPAVLKARRALATALY